MPRSVLAGKTPLHISALRLKDVHVGQKVLLVSMLVKDLQEFTVVKAPFVQVDKIDEGTSYAYVVVGLRDARGELQHYFGETLGLMPRSDDGLWNEENFLISARKRHLFADFPVVPPMTWAEAMEKFEASLEREALDSLERELSTNWY